MTPSAKTVSDQSNALLQQLVSADGCGVAVLITRGEQVLVRTALGRAQIELGVDLSADHVFRIASITKIFTAAMVLKLVEDKCIGLDDQLARHLPDFPGGDGITIRQLLNHTAGISDEATDPDPCFGLQDHDTADLIANIHRSPLDFTPGTRWSYSNSGYILLGGVIESVTGVRWYVALQEQLLLPLGIDHTFFGEDAAIIPGRVSGYTTDNPGHVVTNAPYGSATIPGAAGALVSTLDDLQHWMRLLTSGRVITPAGFQQMVTPAPNLPGSKAASRYGFGVMLSQVRGTATVGHTGQIAGFASSVVHVPAPDITIVLLANDDNFDARVVSRRLAAIALGEPYPDPVGVPMSESEMLALAGSYRRDGTLIETLSVRDGKLYFHALPGVHKEMRLQMTAEGHLHLEQDEFDYWVPVRDSPGHMVIRLDYFQGGDGPPSAFPRIQ